jgi:hypothetical protein
MIPIIRTPLGPLQPLWDAIKRGDEEWPRLRLPTPLLLLLLETLYAFVTLLLVNSGFNAKTIGMIAAAVDADAITPMARLV